jgi:hypothetical protein
MPAPTPDAAALRAELEAAVIAAVERIGTGGLVKADVVRPFVGRGVHLATIYRWFDAIMASGKPGQRLAKQVQRAADRRAARSGGDPAAVEAEVRAEAGALMPVAPRLEHVIGGGKTIHVLERLQGLVDDLDGLIKYAKKEDGSVRNARLLGSSIEGMRRLLETAMKFHEALRSAAAVDALQSAIIDTIAECDAELAERVLLRLDQVAANWGG